MACLKTSGTQCTSRDPSRWRLTHPGKGLQRSPNTPRNLIGAVGTSRGCMALPPHTDQSSALSLQVPLCPLPPVPGYTLVSPHRHFLAAVAETLSLGAPGIQRAQGPVCVLTLVYEALQGCVYVCVCVYICVCVVCPPMLQTAGQSCSSGSGLSVPNLSFLHSEIHSKGSSVGSVFGSLQWRERPQGSPQGYMGAVL